MFVVESECLLICVLICVWFVRLARGERRQSSVIGEMERTHIPLISRSCKRSSRVKLYQTFVINICQWQNFIACQFLSTFFCDYHLSFAKDYLVLQSNRLFVIAICYLQKIISCHIISDFSWLPFVISCHTLPNFSWLLFVISCNMLSNFSWLLFVTWPRFDLTGIPTIRGAIVRFWERYFDDVLSSLWFLGLWAL